MSRPNPATLAAACLLGLAVTPIQAEELGSFLPLRGAAEW